MIRFSDAYGPRFRASHRAAMRLGLAASIAIAVAGCSPKAGGEVNASNAPSDPEVQNHVFRQCLAMAKGPSTTHYNDWDEAIGECRRTAMWAAQYCPDGYECSIDLPPRAEVRAILEEGN